MKILAIDTSGPVAGCAVLKDGKIVHQVAMNHGLTHSETIMPAVDAALAEKPQGRIGILPRAGDCLPYVI